MPPVKKILWLIYVCCPCKRFDFFKILFIDKVVWIAFIYRLVSTLQIAIENGYTKLVLGSCTSRIASHVLAATVKVCLFLVTAHNLINSELNFQLYAY